MTILGRIFGAMPLAGALLLASCGGGSGGESAALPNQQANPGVTIGEPAPGANPLPTESFIAMARRETCVGIRNRLFLIDGKQVFWDRAGNCGDNSYAQRLFGATPDKLLCEATDSIAGPRKLCSDDTSRELFNTILDNLDKADLGLGHGHRVEALPFLPANDAGIAFTPVVNDTFSGIHAAKNVVIKDAAAWAALWTEHGSNRSPAPQLPRVDFNTHMLVGVFAGEGGNGCRQVGVAKVTLSAGKIVVSYEERDLATFAICIQATSSPMHVVAIPRSDAAVEFVSIKPTQLTFKELDHSVRSLVGQPKNVVVNDAAAFAALWAEHAGNARPAPAIDFERNMVIGVFLGSRMNGCYSTDISSVYRENGKLTVSRIDWEPAADTLCTLAIVNPAHLIVVERTDDPVEFAAQVQSLK